MIQVIYIVMRLFRNPKKTKKVDGKPTRTSERRPPMREGVQLGTSTPDDNSRSQEQRTQGKYSEKYKYIRFVERKKVLRRMRQLTQQTLTLVNGTDKEDIETKIAELRQDLIYIEKFPGNEKYISLFPSEGSLSEACIKKQKEIREMIIKKTAKAEIRENIKAKMDVIKNDDFFASPGEVSTPPKPTKPQNPQKPMQQKKGHKPEAVHPSWDAKKNNYKLTGSIADQKFEGSRVVFSDEE